jgi:low affinity Fe/Cu permease
MTRFMGTVSRLQRESATFARLAESNDVTVQTAPGTREANATEVFRRFARHAAETLGSSWAFLAALLIIVAWGVSGPYFHFSDTWQLVINTGTTIITFLMVFLIQNTQNRDSKAIHLKLDELIRAAKGAKNSLIDLDSLTDDQIRELEEEYKRLYNSNSPNKRRRK